MNLISTPNYKLTMLKSTSENIIECQICCDEINNKKKKQVKCPYCEYIYCTQCFRKCLLCSVQPQPRCENCKKNLTLEFISEVTPLSFHNGEYRDHLANNLLSSERSLLPATQEDAERRLETIRSEEEIGLLQAERSVLRNRITEINVKIQKLRYPRTGAGAGAGVEEKKEEEKKKFVKPCPADNCRGFLSSAWKCGMCETYVCPDCHVIKTKRHDDAHVCDPNIKATIALLKTETKPCPNPNCCVPIYKIDGCSLMWCVSCHTPFCWNTGEIVRDGNIHNPHYYEYLRSISKNGEIPRNPGDINMDFCNNRLQPYRIVLRKIMSDKHDFPRWDNCHRMVNHIEQIEIRRYNTTFGIENNKDLRINFLLKRIDEQEWIRTLKARTKRNEKFIAIRQVLEMFVNVMKDLFNNYVNNTDYNLAGEAESLRLYFNTEMRKIKNRFKNTVIVLNPIWELISEK